MWTNANAPRFAAGPQAVFIAADSVPIHVARLSSTQSGTAVESGPGENPPFGTNVNLVAAVVRNLVTS